MRRGQRARARKPGRRGASAWPRGAQPAGGLGGEGALLLLALALGGCASEAGEPVAGATGGAAGVAGVSGSSGQGGGEPAGASGSSGQGGEAGGPGGAGGQAGAGGGQAGGRSGEPYASAVVSFTPGPGGGYGKGSMPAVVCGPPVGGKTDHEGGTDVVSLGVGGEIVLDLGVDVVDGPGVDLLVFENPFYVGSGQSSVYKELGEVSVSLDGAQWATFPCEPAAYTTGHCAGWRPVYAAPGSGVSATDPAVAGGDPFDLGVVGVERARYVKIRDLSVGGSGSTAGFDLDAVAVVNAAP